MKRLTPIASATSSTDLRNVKAPHSLRSHGLLLLVAVHVGERRADLLLGRFEQAVEGVVEVGPAQAADQFAFPVEWEVGLGEVVGGEQRGAERVGGRAEGVDQGMRHAGHRTIRRAS